MKKSLRLILPLLCALFFLDAQASLQQPVQVTAVMIPPYGNYLSDYYAGTEERMSVTLLNRDVMQPEIRVKLRLTIRTSSGATLTTRPEAYFPPIALESNVPRRLMMTDLAPYFSRGSLSNANALANETLPEGFCQFTIEAVEYYTGRTVSGKTTAVAFLQLLKPAKLISPTNKENVLFQEPLNLTFRWQPVTSSGYGAPEYEFTLKEIDDKQANVEAAFLYARTVYQTTTKNTLLPYTADLPMLENGKRYAWQVKASLPTETKNRFQNNGLSEVWLFDLREDCKPPIGLTAEPTHDMMLLKWQPAQGAANYNIQYRREDFDSNVWHDKPADAANSLINDIAKGHSYVFRVGSVCEDGNVVYSTEKTAFMPLQDEEQIKNCGKEPDIDLSNREPKEYLGIGDVFYCADYPVTITEVTGGNGLFSGKGYAPFPLFGALPVNVTFSNVSINADSRMTEGSVAAVRDEGNSLMSNLDRLTEGGTQKLAQGIIKPDIIVDYAIPPTATLTYDSIADTYTIEDENHTPLGDLRMPRNEQGEPVFPVIVKDADENIYRIEETKDENGTKKGGFTFTPLGRQIDPTDFGGIRKDVCDWDYGVVVFTESPNTKYALDGALPYYDNCAIIRCHADAQKENGGRLYNAYASVNNVEICSKWKFMAAGETDEVLAAIDIRNDGLEPGKVLFANAQGVIFPSVYDAKKKTYTVTLTGTEAGTAMTVYALYKAKDGYKSLGYMHVDTRAKMPQQSVVIVNATGKALKEDIAQTLNEIYGKVGVTWNVQEISDFSYPKEELSQVFDGKSSLISQYNDAQKAVIAAFEDYLGDRYDSRTSYVFLFASGESKNRDVAGFMPRGRQYCFIDTKEAGDLGATIAHELGHGRFNLKHPFDDCYGRAAKDSRGTTPLLMDYTDGTSIPKWQWSEIYQPALIGAVFEREERGEISVSDIYIKAVEAKDFVINKTRPIVDEATEHVVATTDEVAIESLLKVANYIDPNVSTYSESTKQEIFDNDANKTVAILLYEFATGTGEENRIFTSLKENSFARKFIEGRILKEVYNDFYYQIEKNKCSYDKFKNSEITISLEFSPDNTKTFLESIQKHIDSNLSQFFIGGAIARIRATEEPNWVIVEVINNTSRKSLMFHIANNYEREKGKIVPLSTIGQRIIFKMKIDTNKFYK